jgi:4-hydroxybenzoate polyprenyltransferase
MQSLDVLKAILRLIRFDKPVGTLLLWLPTAWALWIAYQGIPPLYYLIDFFLGTFFMRSAGCVFNDITDRHIDVHVKRTQARPLAQGDISLPTAFAVLFTLLIAAFMILIQLPKTCFYYALMALGITALYPFCKRFIKTPQVILGFAFSMGIPMAFATAGITPNAIMAILMLINFFWIMAYDTLYAMSDRTDDLKIGVQSTAIFFGNYWQHAIIIFLALMHFLWLFIAQIQHFSLWFYGWWMLGLGLLTHQNLALLKAKTPNYLQAFQAHCYYGLCMWLGLL